MGIKCASLPPWKLSVAAAVSSLLTMFQGGYHFPVINNPQQVLESFINSSYHEHYGSYLSEKDSAFLWGATVSASSIGAVFGSLMTAFFSERFGRTFSLFVIGDIIGIVSNLCMGFSRLANSFELLLFGRLLIGYTLGLQQGVLAIYLSECSPTKVRGIIGSLQNLFIVFGGFIAGLVTLPKTAIDVDSKWPYLLGAGAVPATIQLLISPLFPETPKYLLLKKRNIESSKQSVKFYHGENADIESVFGEFYREEKLNTGQMGFVQALRDKRIRKAIIISMVVNAAQITTGVIVLVQFSTLLFDKSGVKPDRAMQMTSALLATNTASAFVATPIMGVFGRRPLLLITIGIATVCNIVFVVFSNIHVTGSTWPLTVCLVSVFLNMVIFSLGPGPIAYFIPGELTPQCARSVAVSLAMTSNIAVSWVIALIFPPLVLAIGTYSLLTIIVASIIFLVWLYFFLPETRNRSVDEVVGDVPLE